MSSSQYFSSLIRVYWLDEIGQGVVWPISNNARTWNIPYIRSPMPEPQKASSTMQLPLFLVYCPAHHNCTSVTSHKLLPFGVLKACTAQYITILPLFLSPSPQPFTCNPLSHTHRSPRPLTQIKLCIWTFNTVVWGITKSWTYSFAFKAMLCEAFLVAGVAVDFVVTWYETFASDGSVTIVTQEAVLVPLSSLVFVFFETWKEATQRIILIVSLIYSTIITSTVFRGRPLCHGPPLAKDNCFWYPKKIGQLSLAPLCESTSAQRKFGPPFWTSLVRPLIITNLSLQLYKV